jgi:hypothetical protein
MDWLKLLPVYDPGEPYPAFPYQGWWAVLEEGDSSTAIRDQVERLGTDIDQSSVQPFYRFVWLLNRGTEHKTTHVYLVFPIRTIDRTRGTHCFRSEIFLFPYRSEGSVLLDEFSTVDMMVRSLEKRFRLAGSGADPHICSVTLGAIKLRFGLATEGKFGFAGRIVVDAYGESKEDAVQNWSAAIRFLVQTFEDGGQTGTE